MRHRLDLLLLTFACALLLGHANAQAPGCKEEGGLCLFGVFPHTSTRQVESTYSGMAEELSLVLDRDVQLVTASNVSRFLVNLREQRYDIALAGLGHYLLIAEPQGYIPLARKQDPLFFTLVTLADRDIRTPQDIRQRRFGLLPPENGTSIATLAWLQEQGIQVEQETQTRAFASQQECIHALVANVVDVCGLSVSLVDVFESLLNVQFVQLGRTDPTTNIAYIASPKLDPEQQQQLREYFTGRTGYVNAKAGDYARERDLVHQQTTIP